MKLFRRSQPKDVLYLIPVRLGSEQLPRSKVRMLCCDADGRVFTSLMDKADYRLVRNRARKMERSQKNYATVVLEIRPGQSMPLTVEIGTKELWALEHILEHALKMGKLPDVLRKYPRQIIKLGETRREELALQYERRIRITRLKETPAALYRLPYYSEDYFEASLPVYKAEHRYPLIVLHKLPPVEPTTTDIQRMLVMDSDGDLAVIKVPSELMKQVARGYQEWQRVNNVDGCIIYSRDQHGLNVNYMPISTLQRKALDRIARYFEETGQGKQSLSMAVRSVMDKARNVASAPLA